MAGLSAQDVGQHFPTLCFSTYPWWTRLYQGIRFLPLAFRVIRLRQLAPTYSFHLLDSRAQAIGISDGDVRYPAAGHEFRKLHPLIVYLEDRRFFTHFGIDIRAIARALIINIRSLRILQGGSTITQQLARNTLLVPERSIVRKALEVLIALKIEKHYSKEEILDLYCNHVYLGSGIRGFPAAAKAIFRKRLSCLDDRQICGLLGLLRTPTRTFPSDEATNFLKRQGKISEILKLRTTSTPAPKPNPIHIAQYRRPRFTQIVNSELRRIQDELPCGLRRVGLTVNESVQRCLSDTLQQVTKLPDVKAAAGITVAISTGDVVAESAFQNGRETQSSIAYFGSVQPGSTFKTFALLSALQQGMSLTDLLTSAPFESQCYRTSGNRAWQVRNYGNLYRGTVTLLEAFKHSDNSAFARLVELLDERRIFEVFKAFRLGGDAPASPAIVLGGYKPGINLLSLVAAYRAIANGGSYARPRFIQYAEFADSQIVWIPRSHRTQVVSRFQHLRDLQYALLHAGPLTDNVKYAGKTGTTKAGSLFAGYDDQIASAIWVGYSRPVSEGDPKAVGAVAVFEQFMNRLLGHRSDLLSI